MDAAQTVFVVDDSKQMRESLREFLHAAKFAVETFESASAFMDYYRPEMAGCLILDINMPEISGLELQQLLFAQDARIPIIIVSGHTNVSDIVNSMKLGPFDFFEKPYNSKNFLKRVQDALSFDRSQRLQEAQREQLSKRFAKLTPREKQVLAMVIGGQSSKSIATNMELSISTVDNYRASIMKKIKARSPADLTRMALLVDPTLAFPNSQ